MGPEELNHDGSSRGVSRSVPSFITQALRWLHKLSYTTEAALFHREDLKQEARQMPSLSQAPQCIPAHLLFEGGHASRKEVIPELKH